MYIWDRSTLLSECWANPKKVSVRPRVAVHLPETQVCWPVWISVRCGQQKSFPTRLCPRCYCLPQDLVDILNMTIPLLVQPAMETAGRRQKLEMEKNAKHEASKSNLSTQESKSDILLQRVALRGLC